ncbi:protein argonaute 4A-like isoform X1 [Arachis ipaensis]|uniref:protein argonaute 4A-like isoform X1 n=1 Tax=Arachis ipaensis TaxID=130454 RepID=UPI000A2B6AFA|nr:protein argonaute 4A-like isoform X1 [Arachis ipaensis]
MFSLKKGIRDGDDGTKEVTILTLVEKSTLSTLQRASLVEKSRQKPPERMRVLSDALKTSNYGSEPMLQNCEISISIGFTQVDGRVLPSPKVFLIMTWKVPEEYITKFDGSSILKWQRCSSNANF